MSSTITDRPDSLSLTRPLTEQQRSIIPPELERVLAELHQVHQSARVRLLDAREERQQAWDGGEAPDFLPETAEIRESDWTVAEIPEPLRDRRVEITGPVDRKMIINALNSGAHLFMADFEDATAPTWQNIIDGQINLRDAVRREIDFTAPNGKHYELSDDRAVLLVRPRGLHLDEAHVRAGDEAISASLFDAATFCFHNGRKLLEQGHRPYLYLPKIEHHLEARWWEAVLSDIERACQLPAQSIKVTVLIETLPASFQLNEILYELRNRIVGLNCGRWDYIFSFLKVFRAHGDRLLPDRAQVTMDKAFLHAYSIHLIDVCHRRGALAMGGMAAQIPVKDDEDQNRAALEKVRQDKEREARDGHDGTWVAHPALVSVARDVFDRLMPSPNQLEKRPEVDIRRGELLELHQGTITEDGVIGNVRVAIRYLTAWLAGRGAVPIDHLMEDAATAEISRMQLWHWRRHGATLVDGRKVDEALLLSHVDTEVQKHADELGGNLATELQQAGELLRDLITSSSPPAFLTLPAYEMLIQAQA